ncbi:MAG: thermitase [Gaiellaceae bacterium]|jgi:hypothetical protein|nr:thermitase [Gaiellaceae bacterium]
MSATAASRQAPRRFRARVAFACLLLAVAISASFASAPAGAAGSQARLLVKFRAGTSTQFADRQLENAGARPATSIQQLGIRVVTVPSARARDAANTMRASNRVEFVEEDASFEPQDLLPSDPSFPANFAIAGGAWGWTKTRTTQAWDVTRGDPSVVVAVLDTGLKTSGLTDFDGQVVTGWNVLKKSTDTSSSAGNHGTYVAGVVGLALDNGIGNAGYCPGCRIMPVQIGSDSGAYLSDMASGITWAVDHGARVINLSWAGSTSSTLSSAVSYARSKDVVVVAAAGNANCDCPMYPAATPGVIGVAGSTQSDARQANSNYGNWVMVAAPEGNMTSWPTINGAPGYAPVGGTSLASPVVASIAGLLFSANPTLTGGQVEDALTASAVPLSFVRHGRIDALSALEYLGLAPAEVPSLPANRTPPRVYLTTNGVYNYSPLTRAPQAGDVLLRGQGSWTGSAPLTLFDMSWERCNAAGCAAVAATPRYTVQTTDAGYRFRLIVTVKNGAGSTTASSTLTEAVGGAVAAPTNISPPTTSGLAREGETLVGSAGNWSGSPASYAYKWRRCDAVGSGCSDLAGATSPAYGVQAVDVGSTLRLQVTALNAGGSTSALSGPTEVVTAAAVALPPPPSAGAATWTFSGVLNPKTPKRTFSVALGSGSVSAEVSFSKCTSMTLSIQEAGATRLSASGPSVLSLNGLVTAGQYDFVVVGERCSFTLAVRQ